VRKQAVHSHLVLSGKTRQQAKTARARNSKTTANVIRVWTAMNHAANTAPVTQYSSPQVKPKVHYASWSETCLCPRGSFRLGMLTGLDFPGSRKNFPFPGKKIPERENFGKLRTIHRYKIPWQQFVSQWSTPHNGHCPTPGGVRWAASFRSQ